MTTGGTVSDEMVLRRAAPADAAAAADVWLRSYAAALPGVRRAHTDDEVRAWFRDVVVPERETWVVEAEGRVVGLMVLGPGEIDQLYLDPDWRGRGLGDQLVELAKELFPSGLSLWTFQVNEAAGRFYARHGFLAVERTDGRDNEEREPDVRYVWTPAS
jgi:GNAT superfamily N-acetyltransferase